MCNVRLPDEINSVFIFNNRKIALKGGAVQTIDF